MKILLLVGGNSSERRVSLASGRSILDSLKRQRHEVCVVDPATGGLLIDHDGALVPRIPGHPVVARDSAAIDSYALTAALQAPDIGDVDVVFIGLHGGSGENGSLQNLLELAGKRYTGSDVTASVIAMNKAITKRLMVSASILTPPWMLYRLREWKDYEALVGDICDRFEFPIIVKPNDSGSTVGVSKVNDRSALPEALETAACESEQVLVEQYIKGREMTVAILDNEPFPVVEIRPKNELYDYEAKYTKGMSEYIVPAEISKDLSDGLRRAASVVYGIIGASGLARVDFILAENDDFYCLELNTLPGMTDLSLAPMAAQSVGIDFDKLIDRIIRSALKR